MTKTTKTYVSVADVLAVHLECEHCQSSVTIPLKRMDRGAPEKCPNCNQDWGTRGADGGHIPHSHLTRLAAALRDAVASMSEPRGVKVTLEVLGLASGDRD